MGNQPQDTAVSVASDSDMADGTSHEDESPKAPRFNKFCFRSQLISRKLSLVEPTLLWHCVNTLELSSLYGAPK